MEAKQNREEWLNGGQQYVSTMFKLLQTHFVVLFNWKLDVYQPTKPGIIWNGCHFVVDTTADSNT
jgi:hypothetical protein